MKNLIIAIGLLITCLFSYQNAWAQNVKTVQIKVSGNCTMCKERIEEAASIKGVKEVKWDKKKKLLTATYNTQRTSVEKIETAILASGHDANGKEADSKDYNKIPECCRYRTHQCND